MEISECTKIVLNRIEKLEPENATKIIGYLLLNHTNEEIITYAFASDRQILSLIEEAKSYLISSPKSTIIRPEIQYPTQLIPFPIPLCPARLQIPPQIEPQFIYNSKNNLNFGFESPNLDYSNLKACNFYYKGYCKNGLRCRFSHDPNLGGEIRDLNLPEEYQDLSLNLNFGSLDELEMEIREILFARGRVPISIALLPTVYLETYGKLLQAEGYLTESQRHGKTGCSLARLISKFKTICMIERPHGQHSIVLLEDLNKYSANHWTGRNGQRNGGERNGEVPSSSHQIYLTFPAESTFAEADVENYFKQYGPVREVRIPRQERRMFGFVSFAYSETVRHILAMGHPHFINGSRVLVKPYKEKSKTNDRRNVEMGNLANLYAAPRFINMNLDHLYASPRQSNYNERELDYELEMRREKCLSDQLTVVPTFDFGPEVLNLSADQFYTLRISAERENETRGVTNNNSDHDSEIDLPESPFD